MFNIKKFLIGLKIVPKTTLESDEKGELEVHNTSGKLNFHNGTTRSPIVTEDHTATVTNKTIDADNNTLSNIEVDNLKAGVLVVDTDLTSAADTNIPSTLAVKTYVDDALALQNEAFEITVDPIGNLTATDVQEGLEDHQILIDDLNTLSGVAANAEDLGTFTGVTIPNDSTIKQALQALETDLETRATDTDLTDHINDVTGAHAASAISVTPAGNLTAIEVQDALEDHQTDIDASNSHIAASMDVHGIGATASVVGTDTTQTLTNKTIQGASIETPVRSDSKQDTKANLETYALTATNGQTVYATDTKEFFVITDGLLVAVGGGGGVGGVDIVFVQNFETAALSDFTQTGLVLSETNPLAGDISANLTHDSVANRSFKQTLAVDEKFRNRNITLKLNIKSEASEGNVTLTVVDETNAVTLVSSEQLPVSNDVGGAIGQVSFDMPDDCLSFSYEVVALPEAGSPVTIVDDVIAEITSLIDEQSVLVQELDSTLRVSGAAGYGSTGTRVRRFSIIQDSLGSDITYIQDSINGDRFLINSSGLYAISYVDNFTASSRLGITKNSSSLTDNVNLIPAAQTLAVTSVAGANLEGCASGEFYLEVGDIIRGQTEGIAVGSRAVIFTISKQGSLKQVNPNPNSKITIPTSELRMEGASTRGSTATAIVRFDNIAKIRGDAFEVLSDATLGTRIVMKKKGRLNVSSSLQINAGNLHLSKNQQTLTNIPILGESIGSQSDAASTFLNAAGFTDVQVGDILRVSASANPVSSVVNQLNLSFQEQDIAVSVTNTLPQFSESDSSVRVDTANGYGSTGTRIRRFSNVRDNIGNDIEYVPSAVNGDSFVVKSSGIYHISYTERQTAAGFAGISLNANSDLSTNLTSLNIQNRITEDALGNSGSSAVSVYLNQGDVIRAHTNGGTATNDRVSFTISKVGKPNVTGVDVTPFVNIPQPTITDWVDAGPMQITATTTNPTKGAVLVDKVRWRQDGPDYICEYEYRQSGGGTAGSGNYLLTLPAGLQFDDSVPLTTSLVTGTWSGQYNFTQNSVDSYVRIGSSSGPSTGDGFAVPFSPTQFRLGISVLYNTTNSWNHSYYALSTSTISLKVHLRFRGKGLTATNPNILTAPETFSTDTASLTYAPSSIYTLANLDTAPVGTFITFTYAASTNTRTQTTTAPTQSTSDMNVNGLQIFTRAYNAASTAASPAAIAIQIGKGLKGKSLDLYKSVGKVIGGSLDYTLDSDGVINVSNGIRIVSYTESTGVLVVDAGYSITGVTTSRFLFSDPSTQTNGYLVINASKSPALTGVPLVQPRIATIKDVKPSGTNGGTAITGVYATRDLNTLEDPSGIIKGLNSNQITLEKGVYYFQSTSPFYYTGNSKTKLVNVTDSIDVLIGSTDFSDTNGSSPRPNGIQSFISGIINVPSEKTFEIQHRSTRGQGTNGLGRAAAFGEDEVYTTVKITRVR